MQRSGRLRIVNDVSSVGRALAIDGASDALSAATQFVRGRGFDDGDGVTVTGDDGNLGPRAVFFMTAIGAQRAVVAMHKPLNKKKGTKKAAKKGAKKGRKKKSEKKVSAKKTLTAKKKTAKKTN
jgi:hypothetical protein